MNQKWEQELANAISDTQRLFDSRILWKGFGEVYYKSILIHVLVNMKDMLVKCNKYLTRIDFKDDVVPDERLKIFDVTDLISNFRDAACHNDSYRRDIGTNVMSFMTFVGRGNFVKIDDFLISSPYEDDVVYVMGKNKLYLKRHLERSFDAIKSMYRLYEEK